MRGAALSSLEFQHIDLLGSPAVLCSVKTLLGDKGAMRR